MANETKRFVQILSPISGDRFSWKPGQVVEVDMGTAARYIAAGLARDASTTELESELLDEKEALGGELMEVKSAFELAEQTILANRGCLVAALIWSGLGEAEVELVEDLGTRLVVRMEEVVAELDEAKSEAREMQAQAVTLGEQVAELTAEKLVLETDLAAAVEVATEAEEAQAGLDFPEEPEGEPEAEAEAEAEGE